MFKILSAIVFSIVSFGVGAQQINEQWLGHWQNSDGGSLYITKKNVVDAGKICSWVGAAPKGQHTGCISFYDGTISKKDMMITLQSIRNDIRTNSQNLDASYLTEQSKTVDILETTLNQMSDDTFRIIDTLDADYQGSGDCGGFYILDKGIVYDIRRCESAGIGGVLMATALQKGPATGPIVSLDGDWYSAKWKYGYTLKDGLGVATATNSTKFKVGDDIIYLRSTGKNSFEGEQVYQDGKFHPVSATLLPSGSLQFKGEKNISWTMDRK